MRLENDEYKKETEEVRRKWERDKKGEQKISATRKMHSKKKWKEAIYERKKGHK